tara:strand:- start:324 stop:518 length:195 start_codon:yes stop_codon:yes gene_type:complete
MSNDKYDPQVKKIKEYREKKEIIQLSIGLMSKDHDLVQRLKKVTGKHNPTKLRNLIDSWEETHD